MSEKLPYGTNLPTDSTAGEANAVPAETIAVITGGARGIGRYLSEAFATAGYHVVVTATSASKAEEAAAEIVDATGGAVTGLELRADDIDSVSALRRAIAALESESGRRLQVLINNAGRIESTEGPLWEADPESIKSVVDANVLGVALMINSFAPVLIDNAEATGGPSRIIDLNSGSGAQGTPAYAVYSASKASLFRLADSVVHFGHDKGLRIFEMAPGVVETAMTKSMPVHDFRGEGDWTSPEQVTDLALALSSGTLDVFTGRYVRAGADSKESLLDEVGAGLDKSNRRLVLG
ncbi:SDR family NAD(P)-dependent oxidoreductase [Brevibacterium marinum]|uniref:NAD(P)-dependent dehydrogenase (Short-subunit alcohol dehydrogenase family) n=1 Tax=Brevibacterium marinum TaxID=418643 RepID=A0A846RZY4_9MICO|nr:SDR family oxidoreductase [Brevibacterium marinum]NJC56995.1 NAD(P)-dependent dehydrogenase (short-subunit alcohol dehydrogenase family) [Brevibacterium marinum]